MPINMHSNARQNFLGWRSSLIEAYGQSCNIYFLHGLLGFLLADRAWAQLPGNTITTEQEGELPDLITVAARPTFAEFAPLAATATAAQQSAWDRNTKITKHIRESYDALKQRLITSLSTDDISILRNPTTAFLHVTPEAILAHITLLHGTLDNTDYMQLTLTLSTAMTATDTISGIIARHRQVHDQFETSDQALSEYQKCTYFRNAIAHQHNMRAAYESYLISTPLIKNQSFASLTTHIVTQAPNFSTTAAELGYTANMVPAATGSDYFQSPAFAALLTRTVQQVLTPSIQTMQKANSGTKKQTHYCYLHGHNNTHPGSACFKMLADNTTYTDAHLKATTPSMVADGSTATPGEKRRNARTRS